MDLHLYWSGEHLGKCSIVMPSLSKYLALAHASRPQTCLLSLFAHVLTGCLVRAGTSPASQTDVPNVPICTVPGVPTWQAGAAMLLYALQQPQQQRPDGSAAGGMPLEDDAPSTLDALDAGQHVSSWVAAHVRSVVPVGAELVSTGKWAANDGATNSMQARHPSGQASVGQHSHGSRQWQSTNPTRVHATCVRLYFVLFPGPSCCCSNASLPVQ